MPKQNDFMSRLAELVGEELANHITQQSADGIVYLRYPPELLRKVNAKICTEFTGDNHNALAKRYRLSVQHIYRTLKTPCPLPSTSARADQENPAPNFWEAPIFRFQSPGVIAEFLQAVQTAMWRGQTGLVRVTLCSHPSQPPAAHQPDTQAGAGAAIAVHQSTSRSPEAGDPPSPDLSTSLPNQESASSTSENRSAT